MTWHCGRNSIQNRCLRTTFFQECQHARLEPTRPCFMRRAATMSNPSLSQQAVIQARIGSLGAGKEWFKPWRTIAGREDAPVQMPELQVVVEGVFEKRRFLDLLRYFIVFEDAGGGALTKKMAGYHQFHAVNVAVEETLRASYAAKADRVAESSGRYLLERNDARRQAGGSRSSTRNDAVRTSRSFVARRWPAADRREQKDDGVKSLVRRAIILQAGVAELADAQDLKSCGPKGPCGIVPHPRHQHRHGRIIPTFWRRSDRADGGPWRRSSGPGGTDARRRNACAIAAGAAWSRQRAGRSAGGTGRSAKADSDPARRYRTRKSSHWAVPKCRSCFSAAPTRVASSRSSPAREHHVDERDVLQSSVPLGGRRVHAISVGIPEL